MTTTAALLDTTAALRAALVTETRIAEALAQRSRGLVDLVEGLALRALDASADVPAARMRLHALGRCLRDALAAGEAPEAGDLRRLAETTLSAFDFGPGPRIALTGPAVILQPDARRLVALTLFDLAARSERFGALADQMGRVSLEWAGSPGGGLRLVWREFGARAGVARHGRGAGGPLVDLLAERFGVPLRLTVDAAGLEAELTLPAREVMLLDGPKLGRVLVAIGDATTAVTLTALLHARGVAATTIVRTVAEAAAALDSGSFGLMFVDDAFADAADRDVAPPTIFVQRGTDIRSLRRPGPVLRMPTSASGLTAALALALGGSVDPADRV